ncbi:MAG: TPM domain-containing protein [Prolixibacteraceae bacterium]|nr:TPM domain-containing protein [Prolixibacteraceae bacterium]
MKRVLLFLLLLVAAYQLMAADLPTRPDPPTLVTDLANILSPAEEQQLERKLVDFFAATSNQIAVVSVPDLQGNAIADYAVQLAHAWGIGSEKFDNGLLILVKPKTADSRGEVYIAVGYGLEGVIPDATSKQIVENEMIPYFQNNDMFGGINQASTVVMELAQGEYNYQQYAKNSGSGGFNPFIIIIILFFVLPVIFGSRRKGVYTAGGRNSSLPFWLALGMLSGNRGHGGSFSDFSSGSGRFGGGGSSFGSFGGFGGGGFGGGGAGGSW